MYIMHQAQGNIYIYVCIILQLVFAFVLVCAFKCHGQQRDVFKKIWVENSPAIENLLMAVYGRMTQANASPGERYLDGDFFSLFHDFLFAYIAMLR